MSSMPGPAAVGTVVHLAVHARGEVAEVRQADVDEARVARGAEQAAGEEAGEHLGK
jgi:hypothetical protein